MTANSLAIIEKNTALMTISTADQNPALVYLASLGSANSKRAMQNALNLIADVITRRQPDDEADHLRYLQIDWAALRFQHTQAIKATLAERVKYTTANNALSALRGVLKAAYRLGQIDPQEYAKATDIGTVKGQSVPAGRDLAMGEILALVQACKKDKTPAGARDAAMIGVLYTCGMRRSEIVALDLAGYDTCDGKLTIRSGKGNKDRTVYATNGAKMALDAWIVTRGSEPGPLFCAINKAARITGRRMTTQAVYYILKERAAEAGVKDFSPHDMRRTFVGDMLDRGADIATVAKLAGHASITTTARYDRRAEETKKKAASLLHFPF